jgi:hypothetical protein
MAGAPGFEPGMPVPKTGALPLGDAPINLKNQKRVKPYKIGFVKVQWVYFIRIRVNSPLCC